MIGHWGNEYVSRTQYFLHKYKQAKKAQILISWGDVLQKENVKQQLLTQNLKINFTPYSPMYFFMLKK